MTLAVDIGNTNIVIGGFVQNEFQFIERISTNRQATTLEFSVSIRTILQLHAVDASAIDGAILSSVVPSLTTVLSHAVQKTVQKRFDRLPIQAMLSVKSSVSTKVRLWTICPHLPAVW